MGNKSKTDSKLPTEKAGKPNMSKKSYSSTSVGQNATGSEVQSEQPPLPDTTALLKVVCGVQV